MLIHGSFLTGQRRSDDLRQQATFSEGLPSCWPGPAAEPDLINSLQMQPCMFCSACSCTFINLGLYLTAPSACLTARCQTSSRRQDIEPVPQGFSLSSSQMSCFLMHSRGSRRSRALQVEGLDEQNATRKKGKDGQRYIWLGQSTHIVSTVH